MTLFVTTCRLRDDTGGWVATVVAEAAFLQDVSGLVRTALANTALDYLDCAPPQVLDLAIASDILRNLAQGITQETPVQVSHPYAVQDEITPPALNIATVALTPLDPHDKAPFWDRPWCPDALFTLAFEGPRRTYLVIDADKYARVAGDFDVDLIADLHQIECLYNGETAHDLHLVAPYLIDFTLDKSGPSKLHRSYIKQHWGKGTGLIIRSDLDFAALRKHLRGFTRIRSNDAAKAWTLFRFWDPLVARIYFGGLDQRPDRVAKFFGTGAAALGFIVEHGTDAAMQMWPAAQSPEKATEMGTEKPMGSPLVFDAADHALMDMVVLAGLGQGLMDWLATEHPDRFDAFTPDQFGHLAHHILTQGQRFGCETKDDFAFFAQMMLTLGGWFHHSATPAPLVQIIRNTGARRTALQPIFMAACAATAQAVLVENYAQVHAHLAALPQDGSVSPEQFRSFRAVFLADWPDAVEEALLAAKFNMAALQLTEPQTGRMLILTLLLGHRFYADPFRPWARLGAEGTKSTIGDAVDAAWSHLGLDGAGPSGLA